MLPHLVCGTAQQLWLLVDGRLTLVDTTAQHSVHLGQWWRQLVSDLHCCIVAALASNRRQGLLAHTLCSTHTALFFQASFDAANRRGTSCCCQVVHRGADLLQAVLCFDRRAPAAPGPRGPFLHHRVAKKSTPAVAQHAPRGRFSSYGCSCANDRCRYVAIGTVVLTVVLQPQPR